MNFKPINGNIVLEIVPVQKEKVVILVNSKQEVKLQVADLGDVASCDYKVGDFVRVEKYKGTEIELSDKRYLIINHKDIIAYESEECV